MQGEPETTVVKEPCWEGTCWVVAHHFYDFWIQNFFCPFLHYLDPETAVFLQFLDPETAPFLQFLGALWIVGGCLPSPCGGPYGS